MRLREEDITRFQELFKEQFNKEISRADALEQGTRLVRFMEILIEGEKRRLAEVRCQEKELQKELVKRFLNDRDWCSCIFKLCHIPSNAYGFQPGPLIGIPGHEHEDITIDALFCSRNQPEIATVLQVKVFKIEAEAIDTEMPIKLRQLEKGIEEINTLANIGFSRIYLYVFAAIENQNQNLAEPSHCGLALKVQDMINNTISDGCLDSRVGWFKCEILPHRDDSYGVGKYDGNLSRLAKLNKQSAELTKWVEQYLKSH